MQMPSIYSLFLSVLLCKGSFYIIGFWMQWIIIGVKSQNAYNLMIFFFSFIADTTDSAKIMSGIRA
jgi:hypothetical protein